MKPGGTAGMMNVALIVGLSACGSGVGPETSLPARVEIAPATIEVELQSTVEVGVTLTDAAGNILNGQSVHWSSENSGVAAVSPAGVVTGQSLGKTRIAASAAGVDGIATVTVVPRRVATVSVSPSSVTMERRQTQQFTTSAKAADGSTLTGRPVTWSSSRPSVASISSSGRVTANSAGEAVITATIDGKQGTATVEVRGRRSSDDDDDDDDD